MLRLTFAVGAGRVEVETDPDHAAELHNLRTRFPSARSRSATAFELDLDDLLLNLFELTAWPSIDTDVQWQAELRAIVESNAADSARLSSHLVGDGAQAATFDILPVEAWGLTAFQERDGKRLLSLEHGANFSVPGAGKTRVTLATFEARRRAGQVNRLLVVCPKSAMEAWRNEVAECFPADSFTVGVFDGDVKSVDLMLVNYDRLPDAWPQLVQWLKAEPAMLILDEAHRMKLGAAGAWGSACLELAPYARCRLILSGTPAPNGVRDLANLLGFVWPGQGQRRVLAAVDGANLRDASDRLKPLFVRTTKKELALPPVHTVVRRLELPPLHQQVYRALIDQALSSVPSNGAPDQQLGKVALYLLMAATNPSLIPLGSSRHEPLIHRIPPLEAPADSTLNELLRDLPSYEMSPKYKEVIAQVAANAALGRKTLVWSTFVRSLTTLGVLLQDFSPAMVHGGTDDRDGELRRFREDPSCMVLLSNPATLGEGVSLHHECHEAIYVDRDFAAGRFLQSVDRIHRLGLPQDVVTRVTVLVSSGTIDEVVERRLGDKLRFMGGVLDDPAVLELSDLDEEPAVAGGLDERDIDALLSHLNNAS